MGWVFESAYKTFDQYREMWDGLNRSQGDHLLLDSMFVGPLVRYFGSTETLLGISNDHKNPGMVLVDSVRKGFWQTFQPSQGPLGLILLGNRSEVVGQIEELIRSLPRYALGFGVLQQDPDFTAFGSLNPSKKIEILDYIKTPRLTLRGTFEDYWKSCGRNLVHNLSRQRRRLAEQGVQLELFVDRDPNDVGKGIGEYGRLEGSGWKARGRTAVTANNRQGLFYQDMLENFCSRGEGIIYRLMMNGKTVASDLCLERDGTMVVLRTTYDESIEGLSLGLLLHQEIFKALFSEGKIKVVEFYGRVRDWHTKWTNELRTMYHINFYRHRWVAVARRFIKESSRLLRSGGEQ